MEKLPHVDVHHTITALGDYGYCKDWTKDDKGNPKSMGEPNIRDREWNADELQAIAEHMLLSEKVENKYVVGFCFNEARDRVALIQKTHPSWQAGLWNGIGGKIETVATNVYETPLVAMRREFLEETGIEVAGWLHALTLVMENKHLYVFRAFDDRVKDARTQTDEKVIVWDLDRVMAPDFSYTLPNIKWFLPMLVLNHYRFPIVIRDVVEPERIEQDTADPDLPVPTGLDEESAEIDAIRRNMRKS